MILVLGSRNGSYIVLDCREKRKIANPPAILCPASHADRAPLGLNVCNIFMRELRFLTSCCRTSLRPPPLALARSAAHLRESKPSESSYRRGTNPTRSPNVSRTYLPLTATPAGATRCGSSSSPMPVRTQLPKWLGTPSAPSARSWRSPQGLCKRRIESAQAR